ncbi:hypothetical protein [Phenylobacterium sp.]|uniref:hypothetical protein n=1 Tax=Phenylobacterium sp. TaxID=1871053 RepID=UPI001223F546|nr:hypothetical protein [Phenylobacterium sp.]THD51513.1 MAG: hypothetical protein E8A12_20905 [Phenylobacterium sp.]
MIAIDEAMRRRELLTLIALAFLPPALARAADEKPKKKSGGENYIPINPITATTNKAGGRRGVLSVDCGLQVDDPKLRAFADQSLPRLRAAYVQAMQIYAAGLPPGAEPNAELIVQELQRETDLILKRPGARLLIGAIVAN